MKKLLEKYLPLEEKKLRRISIGITVTISWLLTIWGIYGIGQYGIALFILTPLFLGAGPSVFYGMKRQITQKESWQLAKQALILFAFGLILFAMEGLICIVMAAPMAILLTWIGSMIGFEAIDRKPDDASNAMLILIFFIPTFAFLEKGQNPPMVSVVTSIEINAKPETVWKNVIEFPELKKPTEFIFTAGIAYPINARIEGNGVGAIRHCNFTTGSFVEPITIWDEPKLLQFDVIDQPAPLKELSFWDINAPHLHDYFVSKKGQFKLTALPNGKTLLEGTTWYFHNIRPAIYWQVWSEYIIHKIHNRVLVHIKKISEYDK